MDRQHELNSLIKNLILTEVGVEAFPLIALVNLTQYPFSSLAASNNH